MWDYLVFGIVFADEPYCEQHALNGELTAITTAFNNYGTFWPFKVCDGVCHTFFACQELHSTSISSVASSLVDPLTFASESWGGTTKKTATKTTTLLKMKENATTNATMEPKGNNARVLLGSTITSMTKANREQRKVEKLEAANINGKAKENAIQIQMQMRYLTIQSAPK